MHRLAATPGGWTPGQDGVIFVEQTPAPLVLLTAADTDIQSLAIAQTLLPQGFCPIRVANLLQLQQQLTIDTYADDVLRHAQGIVLRLLGGESYWPYGLEVIKEIAQQTHATLFVIPGDTQPDPALVSHSTAPLTAVDQLWHYFIEGGIDNMVNALKFMADRCLGASYQPHGPVSIPNVGLFDVVGEVRVATVSERAGGTEKTGETGRAKVGVLFYRSHYLAGNVKPIQQLCQALQDRGLWPVPIFISSLRDRDAQLALLDHLEHDRSNQEYPIRVLLNTTSFSSAKLGDEAPDVTLWRSLDLPVFQVILSGGTEEQWRSNWQGLSPRDIAMNVALPEVDGRIISRAVSFKGVQSRNVALETDVVTYQPVGDRIEFVADLAQRWVTLAQTPPDQRRIALILANYPNRDGRIANGVGLDTPASCIEILNALKQDGYHVESIPPNGDELIQRLTKGVTNDPEAQEIRPVLQALPLDAYRAYFESLPNAVQQGIGDRWGPLSSFLQKTQHALQNLTSIPIPGIQLGNIFVGIQPSRGYDHDPSLNYHAPDLEPTHEYLAFYHWVRDHLGAHAVVHVGKHGNLEWLPGKGIALTQTCYPEVALGAMPNFYPFIVNDPGEGAQAKRRSQAVIIDHLTPPMTRAELYGPLLQLEALIDEYYDAQSMDPTRVPILRDRIFTLIEQEQLHLDLPMSSPGKTEKTEKTGVAEQAGTTQPVQNPKSDIQNLIARTDGYLCELKEAQIRDGLHIFGQCPTGTQLRDLVVAIARHPSRYDTGLTRAIAQAWGLDFDPLTTDPSTPLGLTTLNPTTIEPSDYAKPLFCCHTHGDAIALIEEYAADAIETLINVGEVKEAKETGVALNPKFSSTSPLCQSLTHIQTRLLPKLYATSQELTHLLHGLNGGYIPSGASGAPTRGRTDTLPTGRNFYSVDIRAIPTESAWDIGRRAAETLVERYTQDHGDYPKTLGLSIWGTSTMRTGGDDLAEALALLGVRPVWDGPSRRVVDFEVLPLSLLERPRVDVTLRISGFFRDAFANLIDLFHRAVEAVSMLDESPHDNPLAAQVAQDQQQWQTQGLALEQAEERSRYRVFGSKPGAYGAGLQGLIEAQNWTDEDDLARAYVNWSSYAYTGQGNGKSAPEAFDQRLQQMQVVLHNQDNREHDLLDSDDYYQFQGGLTAAVRSRRGTIPITYFGDHSIPENPKIRHLKEEIARVYRSRVVNPKWIKGVMRHGYKGAFEMAATVDYLFAYDATTHCAEDHMYEGVAHTYLLDPEVQAFIREKNPWALRDMAERLLEANQRHLWQTVDASLLDQLRALVHEAEAIVEGHTDPFHSS
ncbi:MAG: cobaltochelatase subunit CobN [Merismopedia sp. SIO2A8]|nr:cobaltochelatase subunit CobN [Merismopedia sp. SIO2A8]